MIYQLLLPWFEHSPDKLALIDARNQNSLSLTYSDLAKKIKAKTQALYDQGLRPNMKVLLFLKPSLEFSPTVFALFRLGAVISFIDPGMGRKNILHCLKVLRPDAFIGEPILRYLSYLIPKPFLRLNHLKEVSCTMDFPDINPDQLAAILFTSGGTGTPKGVEYTQRIFAAQIDLLKKHFAISSDDVDVAGFPLFSLFTMALGGTSTIPPMNAAKPAKVNPELLARSIDRHQASFLAGSPAIWFRLVKYCLEKNIQLKTVKKIFMFGAPVDGRLLKDFSRVAPNATAYTPYGATECLPIAQINSVEILSETFSLTKLGKGVCVGKPLPEVSVKIIPNLSNSIEQLSQVQELAVEEIGEIIVQGPSVTKAYYQNELATKNSKIQSNSGIWHRMGDLGYLDELGRIWFCGRKSHALLWQDQWFYSICLEGPFNQLEGVKRSALVQDAEGRPSICFEMDKNKFKTADFKREVEQLWRKLDLEAVIKRVYFCGDFPVDGRHNIKIDRTLITLWIQQKKLTMSWSLGAEDS